MDVRALQTTDLLAAAVAVASTLVLAVQLITPSPVLVSAGDDGATVTELGGYFTYTDVAVVLAAAVLLGASATYLLLAGRLRGADDDTAARPTPPPAASQADGGVPSLDAAEARTGDLLEARRDQWEATAERLSNNERVVYEAVLDADGVLAQADIVDRTDISKASVSRALDGLETRDLVERKRRGMGNVVVLR
ncbi:helix-turn-helix transcriptional regulator [Halobacterium yunchengense]|uniref:helix-turn-helix transcriptional regulator n=1 Tax=Halobacterium yunchengense TaxID=3108497 RepID=UPI00300B0576